MGNRKLIDGVIISPLKKIENPKGDIYHVLKNNDFGYNGFGEIYISTILSNEVKGWKLHTKMICNFVVPIGCVKFVLIDKRQNSETENTINEFILSREDYYRLTVPSNVFFGFQGLNKDYNQIINIANIVHSPDEGQSYPLNKFDNEFTWKIF